MDSFSDLTDDLLIKILSFAPTTKVAVATSVLSKRWLSLWTMVPRLTFEDEWIDTVDSSEIDCIVLPSHAVSGTLLLHKSPVIESFHLTKAFECIDRSEIYLWVRIAVDRFVRDLKISFTDVVHRFIRLPSRLFTCETLETLELHKGIFLDVPRRVSLKSLRTLRLLAVKYADEESFVRLISSSPVLENLVVHSCSDDNVETFTIDVPSLRSLTVWNTLQDSNDPYNNLFVLHPHSLNHLDIVNKYGEVNVMGEMPELLEASLNTFATRGNVWESLAFAKRLSLTLYRWILLAAFSFSLCVWSSADVMRTGRICLCTCSDIPLYFKFSSFLTVTWFVGFSRAVFRNVCCSISKPLSG